MPAQDVELGYLAHPGSGPNRGVVMIHDVWGLADHTRDLARRLAQEDFSVLAVDLYRRESEVAIENPGEWMRAMSDVQVLEDIQTAVDFLSAHPSTGGLGIGAMGFCMGGTYALLAACGCRDLAASVPFYGLLSHQHGLLHDPAGIDPARKPREPLGAVPDLSCPLLAFFGEEDEFVPLADVSALRERLEKASHDTEVVVYPGAGHAFMNDTRPDAFRPELAEQAWSRSVEFLKRQLA